MSHDKSKPGVGGGGNGKIDQKETTKRVDVPRIVADDIGRRIKETARLALIIGESVGIIASKLEGHTTTRKRAILVALIRENAEAKAAIYAVGECIDAGDAMLRDVAEAMTWELAQRKG